VFERAGRLGGQVRLGAAVAARAEFADIVDFQESRLDHLGVEVRCNSVADAATVMACHPDVVVLATGSKPRHPELPGDGSVPVWPPHQMIAAWAREPQPDSTGGGRFDDVVVLDEVGHFPAYVPAELARRRGAEVTVVSPSASTGWALDPTTAATMSTRLRALGVRFALHSTVGAVEEGHVVVTNTLDGVASRLPAALIVAAVGGDPDGALGDDLTGHVDVVRVGDCVAPRTALEAIREGRLAGLEI
jgi:2,4-dienoyl-CoA reductase (NADPH2)